MSRAMRPSPVQAPRPEYPFMIIFPIYHHPLYVSPSTLLFLLFLDGVHLDLAIRI